MDRRAFIATAAGLLVGPRVANAQPVGKPLPRVAIVLTTSPVAELQGPNPSHPHVRAFVHGLRDLGWIDGQTIVLEPRSAEAKWNEVPTIFADLVRSRVDVIVTLSARQFARTAKQATSTIPIVLAFGTGLVEQGLVSSLARPGGNLTGIEGDDITDIAAKRVRLLKEALPAIGRIAVLTMAISSDPRQQGLQQQLAATGVQLLPIVADSERQLEAAFAGLTRNRPDALYVVGAFFFPHRQRIADFALRSRLPLLGSTKEEAEAGALLAYGANVPDMYRRAAGYVDRILKGAKPGDLPVERPTKYDLVINRKTAKVLGITIPQSVLVQATEVIQ